MKRLLSTSDSLIEQVAEENPSDSDASLTYQPLPKKNFTARQSSISESLLVAGCDLESIQKEFIWTQMQHYKKRYEHLEESVKKEHQWRSFFALLEEMPRLTDLLISFLHSSAVDETVLKAFQLLSERQNLPSVDSATQEQHEFTVALLQNRVHSLEKRLLKTSLHQPPKIKSEPSVESICTDTAETESLRMLLKERTLQLDEMQAKLKSAEILLEETKIQQIEQQEAESANALKAQIKHLTRSLEVNSSDVDSLQRQNSELQSLLAEAIAKKNLHSEEEASIHREKCSFYEQSIQTLEAEVTRLRSDRDNARAFMSHAQTKADLLKSSNSQLNLTLDQLRTTNKALVAQINQTKERQAILSILKEKPESCIDKIESTFRSEEILAEELETVASAVSRLEEANKKLIQKISERDERIENLTGEKTKLEISYSALHKERDSLINDGAGQQALRSILSRLESVKGQLDREIKRCEEEVREKTALTEAATKKANDQAVRFSELLSRYEILKGKHEEVRRQCLDRLSQNSDDSYRIRKIQHELDAANSRLAAITNNPKIASAQVLEELDICKKLLKCSSCNLRQKEIALNRCMHVFCRPCIDSRLETRQRKCPVCLDPFGSNDVRTIYL